MVKSRSRVTAVDGHGHAAEGAFKALGVAYTSGAGDVGEPPALDLIRLLEEKKAPTGYRGPFVTRDLSRGTEHVVKI